MKRTSVIDEIVSKGQSNKKAKMSPVAFPVVNKATSACQPIMDQILNNEGLQHIAEMIFLNLDSEKLKTCQCLNKSSQQIFANPMFWLKKWKGLSKKSRNDWSKAIQITRNTNLETNIVSYIKKADKIGHLMDVPCHIDKNVVEKSNEFTFEAALMERNLGMIQILAPMVNNPNPRLFLEPTPRIAGRYSNAIEIAARMGYPNMIKVLAPLIENPNQPCICTARYTPMHIAANYGNLEALKVLATFTGNVNVVDSFGRTLMHFAAMSGQINSLRFLAPMMENPNVPNNDNDIFETLTPIDVAKSNGHNEFARILKSYIK